MTLKEFKIQRALGTISICGLSHDQGIFLINNTIFFTGPLYNDTLGQALDYIESHFAVLKQHTREAYINRPRTEIEKVTDNFNRSAYIHEH